MTEAVWFWHRIVSPHMAGLAEALSERGRDVVYVAERAMSDERASQGWPAPALTSAKLTIAPDARSVERLVAMAPGNSIHICQGLRANGLVGHAQTLLRKRALRQWAIMETADDAGWRRWPKRTLYRLAIALRGKRLDGVLAIGHATPTWLAARGIPAERVFPFAYFLPQAKRQRKQDAKQPFTMLFAGQLIARKRVDLLLHASDRVDEATAAKLIIVGSGPSESELRKLPGADAAEWHGQVDREEAEALIASADCLVLPSRHDGWGAVVSEALMAGTPVICSERCGAAGVVRASGAGGVFHEGDAHALAEALRSQRANGRQSQEEREALAEWSRCLSAQSGASYLDAILARPGPEAAKPQAPWHACGSPGCQARREHSL